MPEPIVFDTAWEDAPVPDWARPILRTGKVFEIGDYPDKNFVMTEAEADAAIAAFQPVEMELEHFYSQNQRSILDGKMGKIRRIWRDGTALLGEAEIPIWLDGLWQEAGRKISAVWHPDTKQMLRAGAVLHPRVTDAALMSAYAAFAGARHNATDQRALDSAHAAIVAAGATCAGQAPPKEARMSLWDSLRAALEGAPAEFTAPDPAPVPDPVPAPADPSAEVAALQAQLAAQTAAFAAAQATAAATFADGLITEGILLPAGRPALLALFAALPAGQPVTFSDALGVEQHATPADLLRAVFAALAPRPVAGEQIPATGVVQLAAGTPAPDPKARAAELLQLTALGRTARKEK